MGTALCLGSLFRGGGVNREDQVPGGSGRCQHPFQHSERIRNFDNRHFPEISMHEYYISMLENKNLAPGMIFCRTISMENCAVHNSMH